MRSMEITDCSDAAEQDCREARDTSVLGYHGPVADSQGFERRCDLVSAMTCNYGLTLLRVQRTQVNWYPSSVISVCKTFEQID